MIIPLVKEEIQNDIDANFSTADIVAKYNSTRGKVQYFMKRNGLKMKHKSFESGYNANIRNRKVKRELVFYKGGKCEYCGYSFCPRVSS